MKKKAANRPAPAEEAKLLKIPPPRELTTIDSDWDDWDAEKRAEYRKGQQIAEWDRVVLLLQKVGRFMEIDQRGLVQLCVVFGWMRLVERQLAVEGMTSVQSTGYGDNIIPHPMNANYRALAAEYRRLLKAFGLVPEGRGKPKPTSGAGSGSKTNEKAKPELSLKGVQAMIAENMARPIAGLDAKPASRKTATKKAARSGRK